MKFAGDREMQRIGAAGLSVWMKRSRSSAQVADLTQASYCYCSVIDYLGKSCLNHLLENSHCVDNANTLP